MVEKTGRDGYGLALLGERIRYLRDIHGLTQKQFGEKIGVDRAHISKIEKGKSNPSEHLLKLICLKFKVKESWLIKGAGWIDDEEPDEEETETGLTVEYGMDYFGVMVVMEAIRILGGINTTLSRMLGVIFTTIGANEFIGAWSIYYDVILTSKTISLPADMPEIVRLRGLIETAKKLLKDTLAIVEGIEDKLPKEETDSE